MEYIDRVALVWSVNPHGLYSEEHHLVGSVLAHMAHIERYGAVYWDLSMEAEITQFEDLFPISGYLYCTDTQSVDYRVRIKDITSEPLLDDYVPDWRIYDDPTRYTFILLNQIDKLMPSRALNEFVKIIDKKPIQRPPIGNYVRVFDPLF
jgi:hypothetical protein